MMFKIYICIVSVTAVGKKTRIAVENTSFDVTKYSSQVKVLELIEIVTTA